MVARIGSLRRNLKINDESCACDPGGTGYRAILLAGVVGWGLFVAGVVRGDTATEVAGVKPGQVMGLSASDGGQNNAIEVSWLPVDGAAKYKVYEGIQSTGKFKLRVISTESRFVREDLKPGEVLYYRVSAINEWGEGVISVADKGFTSSDGLPPSCPQELSASDGVSDGKIDVSWKEVSGAKSYRLYERSYLTGKYNLVVESKDTPLLKFSDFSVIQGRIKHYKVSAVNDFGESILSPDEIGYAGKPGIPSNVSLAGLSEKDVFRVLWQPVLGAIRYRVYGGNDVKKPFVLVGETIFPEFRIKKAITGKSFGYYRVSAVNGSGEGTQSFSVAVNFSEKKMP